MSLSIFFFNDTATTEIYTLSLHDALPICSGRTVALFGDDNFGLVKVFVSRFVIFFAENKSYHVGDRKSTRLNSSHANISYAVFCLKKKNTDLNTILNIKVILVPHL